MLIAGFDAGQTSTRCQISRWDGAIWTPVGAGRGPGVSHLAARDGTEYFLQAIRNSAAAALGSGNSTALTAAAVGASGIEQGTPLQDNACQLVATALNLPLNRVTVTGDERTALWGAFPEGAGIVMISGTGMICLGRDQRGREHRCGGWGWRLDGAGSTFDLGHQGLQLSLAMADGRLPEHPLRQRLWTQLSCTSAAEVKATVVQPDCDPAMIAALAPTVVEFAATGYFEAEVIVNRSAAALARCAATIAGTLAMERPKLVGQGGGLEHLPHFRKAVEQAVHREMGDAVWISPAGDACQGALTMARDLVLKPR